MVTAATLASLDLYAKTWGNTQFFKDRAWSLDYDLEKVRLFKTFVSAEPTCFERTNLKGHMTGSACVVNPTLTKVLLTHHRKLGLWLQLGGHADGNPNLQEVAMTEANEESGLTKLSFLKYETDVFHITSALPIPFDLDDHVIPANKRDAEHKHYDVRYLIIADEDEKHVVSEESHDVRWFTMAEARAITPELSMHRQFHKIDALRKFI